MNVTVTEALYRKICYCRLNQVFSHLFVLSGNDHSPEMLFLLRGVNPEELVDVSAAVTDAAKAGTSRRRIAATGLADVFGIDLAESGETVSGVSTVTPAKKSKPKKVTPASANKLGLQPFVRQPHTKTPPAAITKGRKKSPDAALFPDPLTGAAIYSWDRDQGRVLLRASLRIFPEACA